MVSVLNLKLLRDLGHIWAQALAIALVMACGVATLILAFGAQTEKFVPSTPSIIEVS